MKAAIRAEPMPNSAEMPNAKRLLLERRLRGQLQLVEDENRIRPVAADAAIPISAEQRRIWIHASTHPDLPLYNEAITLHRRGPFSAEVFEDSFNEILKRHDVWRTKFIDVDGNLQQVVDRTASVHFPVFDLSDIPIVEREAEALRLAAMDARVAIPLDSAPLLRGRIVKMDEDEHRIFLTLHHIIFDGVSIYRIFMPELTAIYSALEAKRPIPLARPSLQYADYTMWREQQIASPRVKRNVEYWKKQLEGELPVLVLPTDRPRPPRISHKGSMECFQIPLELIEQLRELSKAQGVTLYMTLLATFKTLLFRYSGQEDLIVGGAADARRRPELERVMGYFLDTIPIRTRPNPRKKFSEFLQEVKDSVLGALSAADVPFDQIVEAVQTSRSGNHHPIFQAFFSIEPPAPAFADGWDLTQMDLAVSAAKFDVYLELDERPEAMVARFMYNTDIFDAQTMRRMAEHWLVMLRALPSHIDSAIGELPFLTEQELQKQLGPGGWNDTRLEVPTAPLHALIEAQAIKTPDAPAVSCENETWSYQELSERVDGICAGLQNAGLRQGSVVAVLVQRSNELIASLLAILKAGCAYLPLDPESPRARIHLCLEDAMPAAILTDDRSFQESTTVAPVLLISELAARFNAGSSAEVEVGPEDLAYVIYTSGTTGKPKGVEISHGSIVNLLLSMQREPGFTPTDRLLAVTTIAFDIAALEIFLPLISGGTVVIATRSAAQDPYLLASLIQDSQCTVMQATPATWLALLSIGWRGVERPLKVLCGGEPLSMSLADRLLSHGCELWNMYGPTETTVWSTLQKVARSDRQISIGKPIANTTAYVVDAQRQLVPAGVIGRLLLGGAGLAKGYRNQPEMTAGRFIALPAAGEDRVYDTGDLAVRRADGTLECLGRADNQVKVRGFRVELEAVENAVRRHPRVATAAARVWPDAAGSARLSVYVVGKDGPAPDAGTLRSFLQLDLPDFMIPSDFVAVDALPISLNGKVDRSMLPRPNVTIPEPGKRTFASEVEEQLAAIWCEVLAVNAVYGPDNFFDLGGHSLLVAKLQRKIELHFGQRLSMATLFHAPTLQQQARLIDASSRSSTVGLIALQPKGRQSAIFWLHPPAHIGNLTEALGKDQPVMGVGLTEEDLVRLGDSPSMEELAAHHVKTIVAAQPEGPYLVGGLCTGGIVAYEVAAQLRRAGHRVDLLILLDAQNPMFYRRVGPFAVEVSKACFYLKQALLEARTQHRTSLRQRLMRLIHRRKQVWQPTMVETETVLGERMTDAAAYRYVPPAYDGEVLLMQPKSRPGRVDHTPGWRAVVTGNLRSETVNGHHDELLSRENVPSVAGAITHALAEQDVMSNAIQVLA